MLKKDAFDAEFGGFEGQSDNIGVVKFIEIGLFSNNGSFLIIWEVLLGVANGVDSSFGQPVM